MAGGRIFCIFLLSGAVSAELTGDSKIIRRHVDKAVHMGATGEWRMFGQGAHHMQENKTKHKMAASEISDCNVNYVKNTADQSTKDATTKDHNVCEHGAAIEDEESCKLAAQKLGMSLAADFEVKNDYADTNYVKNCFINSENKVRYNPTDSDHPDCKGDDACKGKWQGTPICKRKIYETAANVSHSDVACTGEYELINAWSECEWAHDCDKGFMYCEAPTFVNDHYSSNEAPVGCYRTFPTGCFSYNSNLNKDTITLPQEDGEPTQANPVPKAVCKLKSYTYTSDPKYIAGQASAAASGGR